VEVRLMMALKRRVLLAFVVLRAADGIVGVLVRALERKEGAKE